MMENKPFDFMRYVLFVVLVFGVFAANLYFTSRCGPPKKVAEKPQVEAKKEAESTTKGEEKANEPPKAKRRKTRAQGGQPQKAERRTPRPGTAAPSSGSRSARPTRQSLPTCWSR